MNDDGFATRPGGAYRGEIPRCPACADALEPTIAGSAEIDVCPRCGGIWFDWTDGDLVSLTRQATESAPDGPNARGVGGEGKCPRCRDPLGEDRVRGIEVGRCAGCAGAFVSRSAAEMIAVAQPDPEPPEGVSFLERVVAWVGDVLHPTRPLIRDAGLEPERDPASGDG